MIRIGYLLIGILTSLSTFAQHTSIRARIGQGWYDMSQLKTLHQDAIKLSSPLVLRSTSTFPAYLNTQIQFVNHSADGRTGIGFVWDHVSTGGRLAYRDYSGELRSDQRLRAEGIGLLYEGIFPITHRLSLVPSAQLLLTFTTLKNNEYQRIYTQVSEATIDFNALGVGFTPGAALRYQVGAWSLDASIGYHLATAQGFYQTGNKDITLTHVADRTAIRPQWSGVRTSLTVGKSFGQSESGPVMVTEANRAQVMRYKGGLSPRFFVGLQSYSKLKHLRPLLREHHDVELNTYYQAYQNQRILAGVVAAVGGALVGWPMGAFAGGGEFNQPMFITGMSLTTVSVILQEVAGGKARQLVRRYNALLH